jgi:excisionase family DNA binding protein
MRKLTVPSLAEGETNQGFLRKPQVAEVFQVSQRTIEIWMREGVIVYFRIGRSVFFRMEDILKHLREKHKVN